MKSLSLNLLLKLTYLFGLVLSLDDLGTIQSNSSNSSLINFIELNSKNYLNYSKVTEEPIYLALNRYSNMYLIKGEKQNFRINRQNLYETETLEVFLHVYGGEIKINNYSNYQYEKRDFLNVIYLIFFIDKNISKSEDIAFSLEAKVNSFFSYSFRYSFASSFNLQTGITTFVPKKNSYFFNLIKFEEFNKNISDKFVMNIFSLTTMTTEIIDKKNKTGKSLEFHSFDIMDISQLEKDEDFDFKFNFESWKGPYSLHDANSATFYITGFEASKNNDDDITKILIPDNIHQKITFTDGIKHIRYLYLILEVENDIIIKFNLIDKAQYQVKISFENNKETKYIINTNKNIYLKNSEWKEYCSNKNEICKMVIDIVLEKVKYNMDTNLEFLVKSETNCNPTFITKRYFSLDYIENNKYQYYYMEIGKREDIYVVSNFYTEKGKIFARIVSKNLSEPEEGADWKGIYRFPKNESDSLEINHFFNKISFTAYEEDCNKGCYLLVTTILEANYPSSDELVYYPNSLRVYSHVLYADVTTTVPTNEYIIGELLGNDTVKLNKEYFRVKLQYNSSKIIIESQTDCEMTVYIGNQTNNYISKNRQSNSVLTFTRKDIIKNKGNYVFPNGDYNLKDVELVLEINKNGIKESKEGLLYNFIVREMVEEDYDLYEVNFSEKILSKISTKYNSYYRILFVIRNIYKGDLLLSPKFEDKSINYQIYIEFIDSSVYEIGSKEKIDKIINNMYKEEKKLKTDLIYFPEEQSENKYLLVSILTDNETAVSLTSNYYKHKQEINLVKNITYPYYIDNDNYLIFKFPKNASFIFYFINLGGIGEIYWEKDPNNKFYLTEKDNGMSLRTNDNDKGNLIIKKVNGEKNELFAFNLNYSIEKSYVDEFIEDKKVDFVYTKINLPINLYSRLDYKGRDIIIYFRFPVIEYEIIKNIYEGIIIKPTISLVDEENINYLKYDSNPKISIIKTFSGSYDPIFKTGMIRISNEEIKSISNITQKCLYLQIEKDKDHNINNENLKLLNIEVISNQLEDTISLTENNYQRGVLIKGQKKTYAIKIEKGQKYIRLQFSSLNNELSIAVNNTKAISKINKNGKTIYIFEIIKIQAEYLYLTVQRKENVGEEEKHFVLLYNYVDDAKKITEYVIENNEVTVLKENNQYNIIFEPIKYPSYYIIRIVYSAKEIPKEEAIVINNEDNQVIKELNNPKEENGKINVLLDNLTLHPLYIQILAVVKDKENTDYLSYKLAKIDVNNDKQNSDDNKSNSSLIIIVIASLSLNLILIVLIIILCKRKKLNSNLIDNVNNEDFQQSKNKGGLLYNLDNDN